jgi:hypothetical protein
MAMQPPALPGVRPVDVFVQRGDDRLDIAGIEGRVEVFDERFDATMIRNREVAWRVGVE